jgi:2-polyprenyl-3-methyl-5-hydroxy-6-metoxy-1,4-benzoquinol methylase
LTDADALRREKQALEERYGPWTAHNVRLADGLYTISPGPSGDEVKLRRVVQLLDDLFGGRLEGLRVLDLACLEGMYALEVAARGARVVAIEGREANLAKAGFAARALGLEERIDFQLGDVRELSRERHGEFDAILCLGILYHLDASDVFPFVDRVAETCRRALVVDTNVSLAPRDERRHGGAVYRGESLFEHDPGSSEEERLEALWSSLDNPSAWIPTRPSLLSLLARAGFTSVSECWIPAEPEKTPGRITLVALKGSPQQPLLVPPPPSDRASHRACAPESAARSGPRPDGTDRAPAAALAKAPADLAWLSRRNLR